MASFDAGVRAGQELGRPEPVGFPAPPGFKSVGRPAPRRHTTIVSGLAGSADARLAASEAVSGGEIVSLLILSRTALYHRSRFRDGIWLQTGGTFGRAERSEPVFRASGLRRRAEQELERIGPVRGFSPGCARLLPPDLSVELRQLSFI